MPFATRTRPCACRSKRVRPAPRSARPRTGRSVSSRPARRPGGSSAWTTSPTTFPGGSGACSPSASTRTSSSCATTSARSRSPPPPPQTPSRGFLTKNFGDDSINLRVERSETFFGSTVVQARLPSLEYSRRTSRIGRSPFYLALESSVSYLYMDRGRGLAEGEYGRADVHPTISIPWKTLPWLSLTAIGGGRWTEYTDSTNAARTTFTGEDFSRTYGEAGLSLVGPSFSRIYDGAIATFGKFNQVIEPRLVHEYVSDVDDPLLIPSFDELDSALGRNQVRYAIVNRLLAKPADAKTGGATEVASLEIAQTHAF